MLHSKFIALSILAVLLFNCTPTPHSIDTSKYIGPKQILPHPQNGYGSGDDQLAQPDDVEILRNGNVVVTDVDNNRIQLFSNGKLIRSINAQSIGIEDMDIIPTGIATDGQGYIYITLEGAGTIARFTNTLEFDQFIGYQGKVSADEYYLPQNDGLLIKPQGIIVSETGDVFVIDMAKKVFKKDGVRNFGFRKFKQVISNSGASYAYDKDYALSQEVTRVMRKSEGMAISEEAGILFIAEEKPSKDQFGNANKYRYIGLFDLTTGKFMDRLIGVDMVDGQIMDGYAPESIEGLAVTGQYLLAVAEKAGRVDVYEIDGGERVAHFGSRAPFYCDDESDCIVDGVNYNEQAIMSGTAQVHLLNDWRNSELASPDGICVRKLDDGSFHVGVVDQWNSRILIYDLASILPVDD